MYLFDLWIFRPRMGAYLRLGVIDSTKSFSISLCPMNKTKKKKQNERHNKTEFQVCIGDVPVSG